MTSLWSGIARLRCFHLVDKLGLLFCAVIASHACHHLFELVKADLFGYVDLDVLVGHFKYSDLLLQTCFNLVDAILEAICTLLQLIDRWTVVFDPIQCGLKVVLINSS